MMVKKDDVHLVKSIGGVGFPCGGKFDGTPLTSDVHNEYMHGSIKINFVATTSNSTTTTSYSTKVEIQ
jgi:hypothetical protein